MECDKLNYMNELQLIHLIPINELRPHEKCNQDNFYCYLKKIKKDKVWTTPILVERETRIIMDGHHRFKIARYLGLKCIPCIIVSYDNPFVKISSFKRDKVIKIEDVINAGLSGKLLDYKSSCHELLIDTAMVSIPLCYLKNKL